MQNPDIDDLKRLRRMGRRMMSVYAELDPVVAQRAAPLKPTCKVGCAGCCYLLPLVSMPEAVAIAEHFLSDAHRRQLIPALMRSFWEQAEKIDASDPKTMRQTYFQKKVPCTFLDTKTNLCTIYNVRPSACRYHMVASDPALCQPEAGEATVSLIDSHDADAVVLSEANRVSNQTKVPLYVAPLPVMMLWAFKLLIEGRKEFERAMTDPELGMMNLDGWTGFLAKVGEEVRAEREAARAGVAP